MKTISKSALQEQLSQNKKTYLVDVREPLEHEQFNIGGTLLPLGKIQVMDIECIEEFKQEAVVCYCRSGRRSASACLILEQLGFQNVSNLVGGMEEWQK